MKRLLTVDRALVRIETVFVVLFLGMMVLLAFLQVILRNLFDTGLLWADPVVRHLVLWVGFAGAAIASSEDRHIAIDALSKFLPERLKHGVRILTNLFAIAVCLFLADAAYTLFADELEYGGTIFLDLPSWVGVVVLLPGYLLMVFHFAVRLIRSLLLALGKPLPQEP